MVWHTAIVCTFSPFPPPPHQQGETLLTAFLPVLTVGWALLRWLWLVFTLTCGRTVACLVGGVALVPVDRIDACWIFWTLF